MDVLAHSGYRLIGTQHVSCEQMETYDVVAQHLTKRFDTVVAVKDVSLQVRRGEFLALLGPSGCGKTTLLNLIAGFLDPDEGEIYIRGNPMSGVPPFRRNVGMVFQNYALFPHMNVRENVEFGLEMRHMPKVEREGKVREALDLVKLLDLGDRYSHQLSGGQQQRVALARVLVIKPSVLLLDEPLGALDRQLREEMQVELRKLQQKVGITTIFVTHDQEEALTMSDRIVVVNHGLIEQIGSPGEIYEHPRTEFVANFIGVSNTFQGLVSEVRGSECVIQGADEVTLVAQGDSRPKAKVKVVVRPEKIFLSPSAPNTAVNVAKGRIDDIVYLGTNSRYYVSLPSGKQVVVYEQNLSETGLSRVRKEGEEVYLYWRSDSAFIIE